MPKKYTFTCRKCGHQTNNPDGMMRNRYVGCFILVLGLLTFGIGWMLGWIMLAMPMRCEKCGHEIKPG